jgi:hypothetical protein
VLNISQLACCKKAEDIERKQCEMKVEQLSFCGFPTYDLGRSEGERIYRRDGTLILSPEERKEIAQYYLEGHSYKDIEKRFHLHPRMIHSVLMKFPKARERAISRRCRQCPPEKEISVLFRKYFLGQKEGKIVRDEGLKKRTIYRIIERNKEVVMLFTEARRQMAEEVANHVLDNKDVILDLITNHLYQLKSKDKMETATLAQTASSLKTIIECFGRTEETTVAEANKEAQQMLCVNIADAIKEPAWDDSQRVQCKAEANI